MDQYNRIACIQVSKNVQIDFGFSIDSGRLFSDEDYVLNSEVGIPVLLGNMYKNIYDIGDSFSLEYLFSIYNFHVIGFLNVGCRINTPFSNVSLDNYVIMPSFSISNSEYVTDSIRIHYANKTSGIVKANLRNYAETEKILSVLIRNTEAGRYTWYTSSMAHNFKMQFGIDVYFALALVSGVILYISIIMIRIISNYVKSKPEIVTTKIISLIRDMISISVIIVSLSCLFISSLYLMIRMHVIPEFLAMCIPIILAISILFHLVLALITIIVCRETR